MAFAKLVFPSGTFALKKLKEIARVATGVVNSTADLEFADQSLSEVVVLDAAGWSLQNQVFEASGSATGSQYRLTAPCVDNSKSKCLLMGAWSARSLFYAGGAGVSYSAPSTSATSAFLWFQAGSSWSGSTLNNPTVIHQSNNSGGVSTRNDPSPSLATDTIYIFSSARKLIIFAPESSGRVDMASMLEFPETSHTTKNSNIPALCSYSSRFDADSPTVMTATSSTSINIYYSHQLCNWYVPALGTRTFRHLSDYGINNVEFFTSPANLNVTSAGSAAYPLIPLTDIRTVYGEGIHNYSTLTDMYITYRIAGYAAFGDTLSVGGTTYTVMQCGSDATTYRAFAIKKG